MMCMAKTVFIILVIKVLAHRDVFNHTKNCYSNGQAEEELYMAVYLYTKFQY
jgi:hypothetical protein